MRTTLKTDGVRTVVKPDPVRSPAVQTIRIRPAQRGARIMNPSTGQHLPHDRATEVPDCSKWRRAIERGLVVRVLDSEVTP